MPETLPVAELHIMVVLLVFGLGVPAYVFQVAVPDEIKRIISRNNIIASLDIVMLAALYFILIFALIFDPFGATDTPSLRGGVILIGVSATILSWWFQTRRPVLHVVISHLESHIKRTIDWNGRIGSDKLNELVAIIDSLQEPQERALVLKRIDDIAGIVQNRGGYSGNSLEEVIGGIVRTAANMDDRSLVLASEIVGKIVRRAIHRDRRGCSDVYQAIRGLRAMAVLAVRNRSESVGFLCAIRMAEADLNDDLLGIFQVGCMSIATDRNLVAMEAFSRLESEVEKGEFKRMEIVSGYLGMVASWWASGGERARVANESIGRLWKGERAELLVLIDRTCEFLGARLEFNVVDRVREFRNAVASEMDGVGSSGNV
jgi:hypothetical protein